MSETTGNAAPRLAGEPDAAQEEARTTGEVEKASPNTSSQSVSALAEEPSKAGTQFRHLGGSKFDEWNLLIGRQVFEAMKLHGMDEKSADRRFNGAILALTGIKPRDELEAMLIAQLMGMHFASMECLRRGAHPNQNPQGRTEDLNQANKLSRTYTTLLEALNRHRGKGPQRIIIEKVTVERGGQAVVGLVEGGGRGEFDAKKPEPCHATRQIAASPEPAMPGAYEIRQALPVAGDERQEAVPNARGQAPRRAARKSACAANRPAHRRGDQAATRARRAGRGGQEAGGGD